MEDFKVSANVITSINEGLIRNNIDAALSSDSIFMENNDLKKIQSYLLKYIKAYMVYSICGYEYNDKSILDHTPIDDKATVSFKQRNFIELKSSEDAVYTEICILFDILKSAALTDNDLRAMYIKANLDYYNLLCEAKKPRFSLLSKYDNLIEKIIVNNELYVSYLVDHETLINLSKCYILSKADMSDDTYICGKLGFLDDVVNSAHAIYENYIQSYNDRVKDRDSDLEKVNTLKRIIKMYKFEDGD